MPEFRITKKFQTNVERTSRVLEVAEAFGLGLNDKEFVIYDDLPVTVEQGDVVYITGQSGSGKSLLLRDLAAQLAAAGNVVANIADMQFDERPLIDQVGKDTTDAIRLLSKAGLNDAYLLIRRPSELSDGQRYRLALARLIQSDAQVWIADEFGAVLDRVTAKVVAHQLQHVARQVGATLIVATTHTDLVEELAPTLFIEKRFREKIEISRHGS